MTSQSAGHLLSRHVWRAPRIIGTGMTTLTRKQDPDATPTHLMKEALDKALSCAKLRLHDLDALIAVYSTYIRLYLRLYIC